MKISLFLSEIFDFKVLKIFGFKRFISFKWSSAKFEYLTLAGFSRRGSHLMRVYY